MPRNPFINAGAIAVTDVIVSGHQPRESLGEILRFMRFLAQDQSIVIDHAVAASEKRTGYRNTALANYMKSFGVIENPVDFTLGVYFHHCAIAMSCRQLAMAGRYLAHSGTNPSTGFSIVSAERARRINALMLTCGHYDGSGNSLIGSACPAKAGSAAASWRWRPARPRSRCGRRASTPTAIPSRPDRAGSADQTARLVDLRRLSFTPRHKTKEPKHGVSALGLDPAAGRCNALISTLPATSVFEAFLGVFDRFRVVPGGDVHGRLL